MDHDRERLVQEVLDLQAGLYRYLRPAREWLEIELTMPQFKVLLVLYTESGAPMGRLASLLGVTLSTATGIIDRLVERGLVVRQESPHDRRVVVCRLTAEGLQLAERLQQSGRTRMKALLAALDEAELCTVARALELLLAAAHHERTSDGVALVAAPSVR
jgi:DNA-binding MarR family transcriptional regulator